MNLIRYVSDTQKISSYKPHKLEYHVVIRYFRITEIVYHNALIDPIYDTVVATVYIATLRLLSRRRRQFLQNLITDNATSFNEID